MIVRATLILSVLFAVTAGLSAQHGTPVQRKPLRSVLVERHTADPALQPVAKPAVGSTEVRRTAPRIGRRFAKVYFKHR